MNSVYRLVRQWTRTELFFFLLLLSATAQAGSECSKAGAPLSYRGAFQLLTESTGRQPFEIEPALPRSNEDRDFLAKLQSLGANGRFVRVSQRILLDFDPPEAVPEAISNFDRWFDDSRGLHLTEVKDGRVTLTVSVDGILLERLPPFYPNRLREEFENLRQRDLPILTGNHLPMQRGERGVLQIQKFLDGEDGFEIMYLPAKSFGPTMLAHEFEHASDLVTGTDRFLQSLPPLSSKAASLIQKQANGDKLTFFENWRATSALKIPLVWTEINASGQTLRSLFDPEQLKAIRLSRRVAKELWTVYSDGFAIFPIRYLQALYRQILNDPMSSRNISLAIKTGASILIFTPPMTQASFILMVLLIRSYFH